jgi:hypothetical protein
MNTETVPRRCSGWTGFAADSLLEGSGFELLVPLYIDAAGAGQMTAIYGARVSERPLFS